jgi:c-di-GMP-binding flagellar brake protein YcgR
MGETNDSMDASADAQAALDAADASAATADASVDSADAPAAAPAPAAPPKGEERRVAQRKALRGRVILSVNPKARMEARAEDISATGMGIVTDRDVRLKLECTADFHLQGRDGQFYPQSVRVRIMNATLSRERGGFRVGLLFLNPTPDLKVAIESYIQR